MNLTVYRGLAGTNRYIWSAFVTKLETRLRLAGVSYRTEAGSMSQAPRGKVPYVGYDGQGGDGLMGDSTMIIKKFVKEGVLPDLNERLTAREKAVDLAIRAVCEDKLSFYLTKERWIDNFYAMRPVALGSLPYFMQLVIGNFAYSKVVRTLYGQGTGRLLPDEVHELKLEVWENLNALLAESRNACITSTVTEGGGWDRDKPFWVLGRDEPTEADATVYGFIVSSLLCDAGPDTRKMVQGFPILVDYATRVHNKYFSDYPMWPGEM
ncbi:glutathione S-transferase [Bombardia bombarda]|uniref:Glutathione S-transferase n=1 Tax=Bombardia bombarda TaxID=252184 RepID=A0AA39XCI5_9PEZI|nr:glutathione S-transferase [Bombardia bombarda]